MKKAALSVSDYSEFYKPYIVLAGAESLEENLANGLLYVTEIFEKLPVSLHNFRYEEGKWTPKEILLHIIDTERVFVYRALTFARSDNAELPGFDQDEFAIYADANNRTMDSLLKEYLATRTATILFFNTLDKKLLNRKGIANGRELSVGAAGFIICGHEMHHCNILEQRYIAH